MQHVLGAIASLKEEQLDFENLGKVIYDLDFSSVEFESYLPEERSKSDYCRKVLHEAPLECVLLYWPPATESAIHFHQGFWGYVAVLQGQAENVEYHLTDGKLIEGMTVCARQGGVIREPDNIIHKIRNASESESLVTAHFYYPPITSFEGMKIFDLEKGRIGTLGTKAKSASWQQDVECFDSIEENAFTFVPFAEARNFPSHRMIPVIPKPDCHEISNMLAGYYNEQAAYYDNFDTQHVSRKKYTNRLNDLIAEDIQTTYGTISDKLAIACGTGRRVLDIRERLEADYNVIGVDISNEMCDIAAKRGIEAINDDWLDVDLPEERRFDVATFLYAFGHITRREKRVDVMQKVFDHLRPGGTFYLDVFNLDDKTEWGPRALGFYKKLELDKAGYDEGDVFYKKLEGKEIAFLHYFREEEVEELLKSVGFDSIEIMHVGYVHNSGEILQEKEMGALFVKARKGK